MRLLVVGLAVALFVGGCHASPTAEPGRATSACLDVGGKIGPNDVCEVRDATPTSKISMRFPTDYPDQQAVGDYLARERRDFDDWVATAPPRTAPYELHVIGDTYRSGDRNEDTESLVLTIGSDTGVHPVTTYRAFNYNLADHIPLSFETLFKPDANPVSVLKPFVAQQVLERDRRAGKAVEELTAASYRQFAITDDAIIFFFNQDGILPHEQGPFKVAVPRSALASILN